MQEVSCLRLLKKFSPNIFEPKTHGGRNDDLDAEQLPKQGKRGQITDQLVELPIEHQIFDMIDIEGSKGLTITEKMYWMKMVYLMHALVKQILFKPFKERITGFPKMILEPMENTKTLQLNQVFLMAHQ